MSSASWLTVMPVSSSIAAQESTIVTFIVIEASLTSGTYSTTVVITPTLGTAETVMVVLEVIQTVTTPTLFGESLSSGVV